MAKGVTFHHPDKEIGVLHLRLPPTSVEWTVRLNTKVTDTYGGQVIQILSTSYDKLIITGQFGKEGPHGMTVRRNGDLKERPPGEYFDLGSRNSPRRGQKNPLEIGLTQMTAYFRRYFTVATAGGDHITPGGSFVRGAYNQQYMKLSYVGGLEDFERSWLIYPTSFPSYRRSNDTFAPEWRVECEVVQPDFFIDKQNKLKAIDRLKKNVGYRPLNPFSDPLVQEIDSNNPNPKSNKVKRYIVKLTQDQLDTINTSVFDYYGSMLNAPTPADLEELFSVNASMPNIFEKELSKMQGSLEKIKKKKKKSKKSGGG